MTVLVTGGFIKMAIEGIKLIRDFRKEGCYSKKLDELRGHL